MQPEEARARIASLGFSDADVETLFRHFDDAERRGKLGHGHARIPWLETLPDLDPGAHRRSARDGLLRTLGGSRCARLPHAFGDRRLAAGAAARARARDRGVALLPHRDARPLRPAVARGGRARCAAHRLPRRLDSRIPRAERRSSGRTRSRSGSQAPTVVRWSRTFRSSGAHLQGGLQACDRRGRRPVRRGASPQGVRARGWASARCRLARRRLRSGSSSRSRRPTRFRRYVPPPLGSACPVTARNSGSSASEAKSSSVTADLAKRGSRPTDSRRCAMASSRRPSSAS